MARGCSLFAPKATPTVYDHSFSVDCSQFAANYSSLPARSHVPSVTLCERVQFPYLTSKLLYIFHFGESRYEKLDKALLLLAFATTNFISKLHGMLEEKRRG
ncbi:ATPase alpha subunit [Perkinsela sp. CCAP 1560/4]|nr:ATPase alpha subunit [Perkinsela sp. CCAP 1560/4]|eukprot:KNH08430.1 ATPase alpha subunit [Perkinsela sp. CCAP 1560/4]